MSERNLVLHYVTILYITVLIQVCVFSKQRMQYTKDYQIMPVDAAHPKMQCINLPKFKDAAVYCFVGTNATDFLRHTKTP